MATLGKHCKAYPLKLFRQYPEWSENLTNARKIRSEIDGEIVEVERELSDSDYLYLQENFTVTDSIFVDENIIFSQVSAAWIDFCLDVLGVQFPTGESVKTIEKSRGQENGKTG
ncbi:MAG TPA: hypothetical protein VEW46_19400 [Pyrinomonadaceae bacterium]|nr:hypothetical protein [Pyrinomonadaceae bacterium]